MVQNEAGIAVPQNVHLSCEKKEQINTNCSNTGISIYSTRDCESIAEKASEKCDICVSRRTT